MNILDSYLLAVCKPTGFGLILSTLARPIAAEYVTKHYPSAAEGNESGDRGIIHHHHRNLEPAEITVADLQEALRSTETTGGGTSGKSGGGTSGRHVHATVLFLHPNESALFTSDMKPRVSLNIEHVWAFLPGGSGSGRGAPAMAIGGEHYEHSGAASQLKGAAPSAPRLTMPTPFPSSLPPMSSQVDAASITSGGAATGYCAAMPPPYLRAQAAEPAAAPTEPMTFDEGLPPVWSDTRQLDEARRLLLSAAELVWPPPCQEGHSGCGTGGTDSIFRSFVCGQVAEHAITTGIEFHMQQLSSEIATAGRMGGGGVAAVRHEPLYFVAQLAVAGHHAFDAWQQQDRSSSGCGGPCRSMSELLARCGCSTPEEAVERAVSAWQQEASQGGATPLLQLVRAEEGGSSGAAPMVLVRLDVAGLLDLASSIRLAEELAMDLLT